jgi:phosphate transport system permease protein
VSTGLLIALCAIASVAVMYLARSRARGMERAAMSAGDGSARLHSRPVYHGMYVALLTIVPALIVIVAVGRARACLSGVADQVGAAV